MEITKGGEVEKMDEKRAVELLKQALNEIPRLRTLTPEKEQYDSWVGEVRNILELTFGLHSREFDNFSRAVRADYLVNTNEEKREKYNKELDAYETALKSAIHKYELLEAEEKPSGALKLYENLGCRVVGNEFEVSLLGTVDMTIECMMHFTKKLNSQGHPYKSSPRIGGHPDYAQPDRTCYATVTIADIAESKERQVGKIELQLIPEEKTLLKTSHPKEWNSSFKYFLEALFLEFERLGYLKEGKTVVIGEPPKAFIAHGGRSGVLDKLREFIQALGINPLIVELLPTKGMSVDDKVNKYIKDADCGIVLATGGGIVDKKSEKQHPRLNVIDEFERLRTVFPDKTILLLEKGITLPSNVSGLTYEPFVRQSMDRAFIAIARELAAFGILKAVKPKTEVTH